ncbi:tRNA methyltransferase roswell [Lycorma delicatula]|uniref:tRNA methyltransferase roswell n=1 Tax=Lycorma delicatula TaxID=130591 RepID=UPI003F51AB9E
MFSFSCTTLLKNCCIKNLCNKYYVSNACFHILSNVNHVILPKKAIWKDVNYFNISISNNNKIFNCKPSLRCFTSCSNAKKNNNNNKSSGENDENMDSLNEFYKVDEEAVTNGNPDLLKKLKLSMLEVEVIRQEGLLVPSKLKTDEWKELINLKTRSAKLKYLKFLFLNEVKRRNDKIRKERKRQKREEGFKELVNSNHIRYGLGGCTIFLRISDVTMNNLGNSRLISAMQFGQDLIVDCGYDEYMSKKEMNYCAKQLMLVFAGNRNNNEPFNVHFCNANPDSYLIKQLKKFIPTLYEWDFPINVTEKSYLDLFPKEKLVYLTPHCRENLTTFNHDDIYIVGGIVDKLNCEPLSLAKAKKEGLKMAKFPLERYLMWGSGSKSLTLDQCTEILLELKKSGDWEKALEHVPKRKLMTDEKNVKEQEKIDELMDKSTHFGQSYIKMHEWGVKNKGKLKNRAYDFDLHSLRKEKKKAATE